MIWTITPNPALDVTYRVSELVYGGSHRVETINVNPGGKGLNVARVLLQLGQSVTVSGLLGGASGSQVAELLTQIAPGIPQAWVPSPVPTRTSVAIVDQDATIFNEAGQAPPESTWEELEAWIRDTIRPGQVVCICGSLPGDTDPEVFARLARAAREAEAKVIVDTSAAGLLAAAPYADLVKPNKLELLQATGAATIAQGVQRLRQLGAAAIAVSRGAEGMELWAEGHIWSAALPYPIEGNPTGAGDASVAAWAQFLDGNESTDWGSGLRSAVATSAAAVARPTAGEIDPELRAELLPLITVSKNREQEC